MGDTSVLVKSAGGDATMPVVVEEAHDGGDGEVIIGIGSSNSGEDEKNKVGGGGDEVDKINSMNYGGNRWPRQETLALLKIRSDMDAVFRDSSLKGPLWEEVSRKLAKVGYNRSAKKCKEKFENVYKYHKRTKDGRTGKPEGKTYRFFDQLQAFENQFTISHHPPKPQPNSMETASLISLPADARNPMNPTITNPPHNNISLPFSLPNMSINLFASTSSSTASDNELEERYKRKRKWRDYIKKLTREVLLKQEEMQDKFLAAIDKRERERMVREDAWRIQEMSRINTEHEILVQERSTAAAKDAALIAFLQKLSGQNSTTVPTQLAAYNTLQQPMPQPPPVLQQPRPPVLQPPRPSVLPLTANNNLEIPKMDNAKIKNAATQPAVSSSRWPKTEVLALINIRKNLDIKYQENGPKGPLWEEISADMTRLGYNRSAKRCKEKWENINKYFKKVKESNKIRPEDCKTCPYFHQLDALYKEKSHKAADHHTSSFALSNNNMIMEPLMVQPEQQWRPPPVEHDQKQPSVKEDDYEDIEGEDEDEMEEEASMGDEEGGAGNYEIVKNKLVSSMDTVE
ncbi:Trihelix transcription factor GT-2 [Quillaja saponaria]|uniref:Trihelix transcription factor GT-2 n=1 Tax=Quillaja saponaria TaxID=32244 RepID=A0AAD7Q396_QUISA|nr:Trihelix transcription factor GT-2 [Quillaja saponaria]